MMKMEILEIAKDPQRLNLLADEFRCGRHVGDLLALLSSSDDEIVEVAVWISGEINIAQEKVHLFTPPLTKLLNHVRPSIRFKAIAALFPLLERESPALEGALVRLCADPNESVRSMAQAALKRISTGA